MDNEFSTKLEAARKAGKNTRLRKGQKVKALTLRAIDEGITDPIAIMITVMDARGELPGWLAEAPRHEVYAVLQMWSSVQRTIKEVKK